MHIKFGKYIPYAGKSTAFLILFNMAAVRHLGLLLPLHFDSRSVMMKCVSYYTLSPLEFHLTTSELWFGQEQEGILP